MCLALQTDFDLILHLSMTNQISVYIYYMCCSSAVPSAYSPLYEHDWPRVKICLEEECQCMSRVAHSFSFSSRRSCWPCRPWRSPRSCYTLHYCTVSLVHYVSTGSGRTWRTRRTRRSLVTFCSRIAKSCSTLR